jgi:hypothetical protein
MTAWDARQLRRTLAFRMLVEFFDGVANRDVAVSALQDYGYSQDQATRMVERVYSLWLARHARHVTRGAAA